MFLDGCNKPKTSLRKSALSKVLMRRMPNVFLYGADRYIDRYIYALLAKSKNVLFFACS